MKVHIGGLNNQNNIPPLNHCFLDYYRERFLQNRQPTTRNPKVDKEETWTRVLRMPPLTQRETFNGFLASNFWNGEKISKVDLYNLYHSWCWKQGLIPYASSRLPTYIIKNPNALNIFINETVFKKGGGGLCHTPLFYINETEFKKGRGAISA